MGWNRLSESLTHIGMGQDEMVIDLEQRQLLTQPVFTLTRGRATPPDRRDPLSQTPIEPVTVDGGIAPSTSASKPCVPLLRHTAPQ